MTQSAPVPRALLDPEHRFEQDLQDHSTKLALLFNRIFLSLQLRYNVLFRTNSAPTAAFKEYQGTRAHILKLMLVPQLVEFRQHMTREEYLCIELIFSAATAGLAEQWYISGDDKTLWMAKELS